MVWGRSLKSAEKFKFLHAKDDWNIKIAQSPKDLAQHSNLIVTTTPAENPLLNAKDILKGTHITAVGSDTSHKQELDSQILADADLVISDSIEQSKSRGEIFKAREAHLINDETVIEMGHAIQQKELQRQSDQQITVVDLTGVAVQDMMIAKAVYLSHKQYQQNN